MSAYSRIKIQKQPLTTLQAQQQWPYVSLRLNSFFFLHLDIFIKTIPFGIYGLIVTVKMIPPAKNNLVKKNAEITDNEREK